MISIEKIWSIAEPDEYVVMPSHIHLILKVVGDEYYASPAHDYDRTKMTVSKIFQQYKTACTKEFKGIDKSINKVWQKSFYDRIVRNERELYFVRRYIKQNPMKWDLKKNVPKNVDLQSEA